MDVSAVWSRGLAALAMGVTGLWVLPMVSTAHEGAQSPDKPIAQGRPAAPLPADLDRFYERRVVRRTVAPDPARVSTDWSPVVVSDTGAAHPAVWMHWDDQSLAIAVTVSRAEPVALDLDLDGDGFDKGMANLRVAVAAGEETGTVHRWERKSATEPGVWKESPKVDGAWVALRGATACVIVLRKSSAWELPLRVGAAIGVRVHRPDRQPALVPPDSEAALRLELADEIPAAGAGVTVRVTPRRREIVPGAKARVSVEVANVTEGRVTLAQIRVGGSDGDSSHVSGATVPGTELGPGEKFRRDFDLPVAEAVGIAAFTIETTATMADGRTIVAKTSLDRIEPFAAELQMPPGTVSAGGDERSRTRVAMVVLRGKSDIKADGTVELTVPPGWIVDGPSKRTVQMSYATEVKGAPFKIRVPLGAPSGVYPLNATVTIAGRTYEVRAQVTVAGGG